MTFAPSTTDKILSNARKNHKGGADPHTIEEPFLVAFINDLRQVNNKIDFFNSYYPLIVKPLQFTNPCAKVLWWAFRQTCDYLVRENEERGTDEQLDLSYLRVIDWLNLAPSLKYDSFSGHGVCTKTDRVTKEQVISYLNELREKKAERTAFEYMEWWQKATADKRFIQELEQISKKLELSGDLVGFHSSLNTIKREVESLTRPASNMASINLGETAKEHISSVLKQSSAVVNFIPTADKEMNEKIFGFARGDLSLITARPNHGKSMHSLRHAYSAYRAGYRVFYLSLEMPEKKIIRELMTIACHISKEKMTNITSDIEEEEIVNQFYNQVQVDGEKGGQFIYQVVENINVRETFAILETHLEYMGFDAIFIDLLDYVQIPASADNLHGQGGYYDTFMADIIALARKYNCAIVGVVQMKAEAILNNKTGGVEAIGNSAAYGKRCNFAIFYERPSNEFEGKSYYSATVIKDREMGQLNKSFIYMIDTDTKRTLFRPDIKSMQALERRIDKEQKKLDQEII